MELAPSPYLFQAAVERPLSLVFQAPDGRWEGHDYCVTVVAERQGLDELDVVVDFKVLEAELNSVLDPMRGHSLNELGMGEPLDVAKAIARAIAPTIAPPARLASVSLQDGTGRRITLQP